MARTHPQRTYLLRGVHPFAVRGARFFFVVLKLNARNVRPAFPALIDCRVVLATCLLARVFVVVKVAGRRLALVDALVDVCIPIALRRTFLATFWVCVIQRARRGRALFRADVHVFVKGTAHGCALGLPGSTVVVDFTEQIAREHEAFLVAFIKIAWHAVGLFKLRIYRNERVSALDSRQIYLLPGIACL